jgi:hypothetical protein
VKSLRRGTILGSIRGRKNGVLGIEAGRFDSAGV